MNTLTVIPHITRAFITNPRTRPALNPKRTDAHIIEVRRIVVHWTANTGKGADANAHRKYFDRNPDGRAASCHYFVDERNIIQIIPDNEMALHCGERWGAPGAVKITGDRAISPNRFTVGLELCVNSDGDFKHTEQRGAWLAAYLLRKHNLPISALIRHFDVTGKRCPQMYLTPETWAAFCALVQTHFEAMRSGEVTAKELNVRSGPGVSFPVIRTVKQGEKVAVLAALIQPGQWAQIEAGQWVNSNFLKTLHVVQ